MSAYRRFYRTNRDDTGEVYITPDTGRIIDLEDWGWVAIRCKKDKRKTFSVTDYQSGLRLPDIYAKNLIYAVMLLRALRADQWKSMFDKCRDSPARIEYTEHLRMYAPVVNQYLKERGE